MFTKVLLLSQLLALSYAQLGIPNSNLAGTPWPLRGGKEIDASVFSEEHALDYEWMEHRTPFHEPETSTMPSFEVEQEATAKIPDDGLAAAADGIALDTGAKVIPETTTPEPETSTVPETTQPITTTTTEKSHEHEPHPEMHHPLPYPQPAQKPIPTEPVPAYKPVPASQHGFPSLEVEQEATAKIPDDGLAAAADGIALDTGAKVIPETTTPKPETSTVPETTQPTTTTTTTTTTTEKPHEHESHPEIRPHAYPLPYPQPAQKPIPTEPVPAYKPATVSQHGFAPYPAFGHSGYFPQHPHHFPRFGHGAHFGPHFHHSHHHHHHPHMDFDESNSDEQSGEDIMSHHPKKSQEDYPRAYVHPHGPPFIHSFPSPARGYNSAPSYGYGR